MEALEMFKGMSDFIDFISPLIVWFWKYWYISFPVIFVLGILSQMGEREMKRKDIEEAIKRSREKN